MVLVSSERRLVSQTGQKVPLSVCEARAKEFGTYVGADEPMDAVLFYEAATNKKLL
jgi:hypothetical protein